jgi:hypothetical protein
MAKSLKINRFDIDRNLAYAIQQTTGESTEDILAYFLGIATFVGEDAILSTKARRLNKELVLFYKETSIPFKLDIWGHYNDRLDAVGAVRANIKVKFPVKSRAMDVTELIGKITEIGLGLVESDENLPKFEKPILKTPKCLKTVRISQNETRK